MCRFESRHSTIWGRPSLLALRPQSKRPERTRKLWKKYACPCWFLKARRDELTRSGLSNKIYMLVWPTGPRQTIGEAYYTYQNFYSLAGGKTYQVPYLLRPDVVALRERLLGSGSVTTYSLEILHMATIPQTTITAPERQAWLSALAPRSVTTIAKQTRTVAV